MRSESRAIFVACHMVGMDQRDREAVFLWVTGDVWCITGECSDMIKWKTRQVIKHDGLSRWSSFRINFPRLTGRFSSG